MRTQSRDEVLYDGQAASLSSVNDKGEFSILPYHANFITLLNTEIKVVDVEKKEHVFKVNNGVLRIESNKAEVYLGVKIDIQPTK